VLVITFDVIQSTWTPSSNPEAAFWVSKMKPKPRDTIRHPQWVPDRGVAFEHRFGLLRLVKIQVSKPYGAQLGNHTLRE
jgi:hypothetical protein